MAGLAGLHWSQCSLHNAIKQHQAMEIALTKDELREEMRFMHNLAMAEAKDEGRSDMDKFHKELKAKSEILQCITQGLIYKPMMAPDTKQEIKKPGIKQSENHVASRTVDGNPVKENQVIDETGAERNK